MPGVGEPVEIDEHEVRGAESDLRRLGAQPKGRNFAYWIVANRKLAKARKTSDWAAMASLYNQLARRLYEDGKSHMEVATAAQTCELRAYLPFGIEQVEVATAGESSCAHCRSLHGRRLMITEAIDEMPLPVKNCTDQTGRGDCGWCRCSYTAVLDS
jgi:ribosomal protein S11